MKLLDEAELRKALSWPAVLDVLTAAFRVVETFAMPERLLIPAPQGGSFLTMPCADGEGWFGVKQVTVLPDNAKREKPTVQAWYTLFDAEGSPALACEASLLTRIRTAATSALAAKYLAPEPARALLVVGTGSLAPYLAEAHAQVRDYQRVMVWGRNPAKAKITAAAIQQRVAAEVEVVGDLKQAVSDAEVISLATTARAPIISGAYLKGGQHLDLVGAFTPEMAEADPTAIKLARVFVDQLTACQQEAGDLIQAAAQGWSFAEVKGELCDLVLARLRRSSNEEITLFKSVGLALEDLVVARLLCSSE